MTNIIILFCTIMGGFLVGRHFEKREKQRGEFFSDLGRYVKLLKSNVKGRRVELRVFNEQFAQSCSAVFAKFLQDNTADNFLTKSQRQLITCFVDSLSTTTSSQLLNNLDYYEQLVTAESNAISDTVRNRSVCVKLGVLLGVMVGILLM